MTAFKIVQIPPPIRDHIVQQYLRTSKELVDCTLSYEKAVKRLAPREHLISQMRLLNIRHEALLQLLFELTRYNDQVRANINDFLQLEKARALGQVAQA